MSSTMTAQFRTKAGREIANWKKLHPDTRKALTQLSYKVRGDGEKMYTAVLHLLHADRAIIAAEIKKSESAGKEPTP